MKEVACGTFQCNICLAMQLHERNGMFWSIYVKGNIVQGCIFSSTMPHTSRGTGENAHETLNLTVTNPEAAASGPCDSLADSM